MTRFSFHVARRPVSLSVFALLAVLIALPCAQAAAADDARPLARKLHPRIVNGIETQGLTSTVALLAGDQTFCTGTVIGCNTVLTAAHCVCLGSSAESCGTADPSEIEVFAQHGGFFPVDSIDIHPDFAFGTAGDLAILHLGSPASGIGPSKINGTGTPVNGSAARVAGFGVTDGDLFDSGIKRTGLVTLDSCSVVPEGPHICWEFQDPVGDPGDDSNTCFADSGGPLFVGSGADVRLAGITSGGTSPDCLALDNAFDTNVFFYRDWVQMVAGADLSTSQCGGLPAAGTPDAPILAGDDEISNESPAVGFDAPIPAGVGRMRVVLNGEDGIANDFDLLVNFGSAPGEEGPEVDCVSERFGTYEICDITEPAAGDWFFDVYQFEGEGRFQLTVTLFDEVGTEPGCVPGPKTLCLGAGNRFEVTTKWRNFEDETGEGDAVDVGLDDSGLFTFFGEQNLEVLVKVLDACSFNDRFWVFAAATTSVEYTLRVVDTETGEVQEYFNPLGNAAAAITDTSAFETCP